MQLHVRQFQKMHQQSALAKMKFLFWVFKSCTMYPFTGFKDVSDFFCWLSINHQTISALAISISPSETRILAVAFNKKSETFSLELICKSLGLQTHIPPSGRIKNIGGTTKVQKTCDEDGRNALDGWLSNGSWDGLGTKWP